MTGNSKSDSWTASRMLYSRLKCWTLDLIPETLYIPSKYKPVEQKHMK